MDQDPDSIIKNFEKVNIPLPLLCQTARLIRASRKLDDNIVYGLQLGTSLPWIQLGTVEI